MKELVERLLPLADRLIVPWVYPSAWLLKAIRRVGVHRLPQCRHALMNVGVFPIRDHYFEPQFDHRSPRQPLSRDRCLPAIAWNTEGQLEMLARLSYAHELEGLALQETTTGEFCLDNGSFESGDAEYWYQLIRAIKPLRLFEIGSGASTSMALKALRANREEDRSYNCKHVCIEPYEQPWLEKAGVSVVRQKVEDLEEGFFTELSANDILFIDSSHVIRPQGDVLFEYLELLPSLAPGVIVHVHDIFTPKNYPERWLRDDVRFWNEQYLLEAFLSNNGAWEILGALNYLHHHHYEHLAAVAPFLTPQREPGSFYLRKVA